MTGRGDVTAASEFMNPFSPPSIYLFSIINRQKISGFSVRNGNRKARILENKKKNKTQNLSCYRISRNKFPENINQSCCRRQLPARDRRTRWLPFMAPLIRLIKMQPRRPNKSYVRVTTRTHLRGRRSKPAYRATDLLEAADEEFPNERLALLDE